MRVSNETFICSISASSGWPQSICIKTSLDPKNQALNFYLHKFGSIVNFLKPVLIRFIIRAISLPGLQIPRLKSPWTFYLKVLISCQWLSHSQIATSSKSSNLETWNFVRHTRILNFPLRRGIWSSNKIHKILVLELSTDGEYFVIKNDNIILKSQDLCCLLGSGSKSSFLHALILRV